MVMGNWALLACMLQGYGITPHQFCAAGQGQGGKK